MHERQIKHIWFDFAGTLYRENPSFIAAHDNLRFSTYANLKGVDDPEVAKREYLQLLEEYGSNAAVFHALGKPADYWAKQLDAFDFSKYLKADPDLKATLLELKRIVPFSLFSNFVEKRMEVLLQLLGIPKSYFRHVLSAVDLTKPKPALDGFYVMVERTAIPAGQILYVGDQKDKDILPAKRVGMQTCLIYGQSNEADYCVSKLSEVKAIVRGKL